MTAKVVNKPSAAARFMRKRVLSNWQLLAMILIPLAWYIIFCYTPMAGVQIAFKNFKARAGIWGSPWATPFYKHFARYFSSYYAWSTIWNTLALNLGCLAIGFPMPIILALLLNEIHHSGFKRTVQTITYMPYFISLVVTCSIIKIYCQENGLFSQIAMLFGGQKQNFLINPGAFRTIYVVSGIWQNIGWNSILYLAALSGIDQEQYEAARIDGANRFQQIWNITIPGILPTIMIMFVLRMGSILNVGYEKVLLLYTDNTLEVADVFSTYTYRMGFKDQKYSLSTAVGLFNTLVNICFLMLTNWFSRKTTESGLF